MANKNIGTEGEIDLIRLDEQVSKPSTPASGYSAIYAKTDGLYIIDDAGTETGPFGAGGGGDSVYTAAYASRPAASNDGDLFLPSDGFTVERDTGSAWVPWGPVFPLVAPVSGDFAWINQGSATLTVEKGGNRMDEVAAAAHSVHIRKKSAPAAPWTLEVMFMPDFGFSSLTNWACVLFRESSTGKLHAFHLVHSGPNVFTIYSSKWTNPTTFSAHYQSQAIQYPMLYHGPFFVKIEDNNTNRVISFSPDGQNWTAWHSVTRADFLTGGADEIGWGINTNATTGNMMMNLLHWKEG
jgi:hypothetical protein